MSSQEFHTNSSYQSTDVVSLKKKNVKIVISLRSCAATGVKNRSQRPTVWSDSLKDPGHYGKLIFQNLNLY